MNSVEVNEIELMEELKDRTVGEVYEEAIKVAQEFSLDYCFRNDCQHVGANSITATELKRTCGDLTIEQLLPGHQYEFGRLRFLMREVLMPRGLVQLGFNPYSRENHPTEWKSYASADQFIERFNS